VDLERSVCVRTHGFILKQLSSKEDDDDKDCEGGFEGPPPLPPPSPFTEDYPLTSF
jgi:hypothetical protein